MLRERQGEIAVAAIKFEQVAAEVLRDITRPAEHFFAHAGVGLGETAFNLAVAEGFAVYVQLFGYIVLSQNNFLPPTPTDDMNAQFPRQGFGGTLPRFAQFFVVNHGNEHLAAQCRQKFNGVPAVFEFGILHGGFDEFGHQSVDGFGGGGKLVAAYQACAARFLPALEHGVKHFAAFVPNTEFGTHPIMLFWGFENLNFRKIQTLKKLLQVLDFLVELLRISSHVRLI